MEKGNLFERLMAIFFTLSLVGCAIFYPTEQRVVDNCILVAQQVTLGMDKQRVKQILDPSQKGLMAAQSKLVEQYIDEEILVEILYFRSSFQRDGILTDDEFTPYIFNNGVLVAIGWTTLGGPKTQAQPVPESTIYSDRTTVFF